MDLTAAFIILGCIAFIVTIYFNCSACMRDYSQTQQLTSRIWTEADINRAMNEMARESQILKGSFTFSTVADQRFYDLTTSNGEEIIEVISVDYDGKDIPRLTGRPETRDFS